MPSAPMMVPATTPNGRSGSSTSGTISATWARTSRAAVKFSATSPWTELIVPLGTPIRKRRPAARRGGTRKPCATEERSRGAPASDPAVGGGREDRARRFRADRERDKARCHRRAGPRRRPAAPVVGVPRRLAGPREGRVGLVIAHPARELHHRQLGHEKSTRGAEPGDERRD